MQGILTHLFILIVGLVSLASQSSSKISRSHHSKHKHYTELVDKNLAYEYQNDNYYKNHKGRVHGSSSDRHLHKHKQHRHGGGKHYQDSRGILSQLIQTPVNALNSLLDLDPIGAVKDVYNGLTGAAAEGLTKFGNFASVVKTALINLSADELNDFWGAANRPIHYQLFTQKNKKVPQMMLKDGSIDGTNFNKHQDTKIIIHGFAPDYLFTNSTTNLLGQLTIKDKYIKAGSKANLIVCDWTSLTRTLGYIGAAASTRVAGADVAKFLMKLQAKNNVDFDRVHIIGFSLGAHVSGIAGQIIAQSTEKKVGRITGLDPAGFLFDTFNEQTPTDATNYLDKSDAKFVDIIHCNYGRRGFVIPTRLGTISPSGHVDFFPNGGIKQPGCGAIIDDPLSFFQRPSCSHSRCWQLYAQSVIQKIAYLACKCDSWEKYRNGHCESDCANDKLKVFMGDFCSPKARGKYWLDADVPGETEYLPLEPDFHFDSEFKLVE